MFIVTKFELNSLAAGELKVADLTTYQHRAIVRHSGKIVEDIARFCFTDQFAKLDLGKVVEQTRLELSAEKCYVCIANACLRANESHLEDEGGVA